VTNWTTPGIGSGDIGASFKILGIDASGYQRKSVALDTASVQTWVKNAAANQGVVLANQDANKVLRIFSSEASDTTKRPTLSITYQ
jgi:hypothetical protein